MGHRSKFATLKSILTSEYWLLFSLSGVFFCFFAHGAGANLFAELCGIFLIIELLLGSYRLKQIPSWYLVFAAICAYLVLASLLNPYGYSYLRYIKRLGRMVIIVFAIHCLSQKDINDRMTLLFSGMLVLSVCWQFAAHSFFNMPNGTYDNRHYLAGFAILALPLIGYYLLVTPKWYKYIFLAIGILNAYLLWQTSSRPAFWTVACVALFVLIFQSKGWYRWIGLIVILLTITVLYLTDYRIATTNPNNPVTLKNIFHTLAKEERILIWKDTWKMLMDNSFIGWIFGNGIGSFRERFVEYVIPKWRDNELVSPHSFFLDILYQNGVVGFILVFGGFGFLLSATIIKARNTLMKQRSTLLKCMIILFLIWFIYCGLVFPIYSNYSLIPLAFILGSMLLFLEKTPGAKVLDQNSTG